LPSPAQPEIVNKTQEPKAVEDPSLYKKKRKRNEHLNRRIEVKGESFEFERYQVEDKTPKYGPDFELEPNRNS